MDDKMIIDFINNVEPDFSYGSSDGMTRAMIESAENMALINDFITESAYLNGQLVVRRTKVADCEGIFVIVRGVHSPYVYIM